MCPRSSKHLSSRLVLRPANMLQAKEIHTWGCDAATVLWLPLDDGGSRLTVAHFKDGRPTYDDALSRLSDVAGPLVLMLPMGLAAALRWELDGGNGLKVGREAVRDGTLLALLHRGTADRCWWDALLPHLTRRHTYMTNPPPQGQPCLAWEDLLVAFHDHRILSDDMWQAVQQKTLGRDYGRRVRDPLRQRWDDLWLRLLDPWTPASHLPHTCQFCGDCDTVSSATPSSESPGRESHPAGAPSARRSPLRVLNGVAHVPLVWPAPIHGGHHAADGRKVGHLPPQQPPGPAAYPVNTPPHGRGSVPEPGAGHVPGRSVRAGRGTSYIRRTRT